nr:ISKra4 family transposase [Pyrinomonadaceae bacterium]
CYYCLKCRASRCPLDEQLGQSPRHVSAGVERGLSLLSTHLSFATAAHVMREIGHVAVSGRQVETISEAVGEEAVVTEAAHIAAVAQAELAPLAVLCRQPTKPRTWIVEMDGVQVGLQDGSWQEVKCGIIYQLADRVEISAGRWELLRRARCVGRESATEFRQRLWALLHHVGVCDGDSIVVVADGAEWIDNTVEELFVGATRIMDFYHTAERIWAVAAVRFGAGTAAAQKWAAEKLHALKAGEVREVVSAFKRLKLQEAEAQGVREASVSYLEGHQGGMQYDKYKEAGLPIGSGAIEGSCKYLVTARCKQAGMRWTEKGVDAVLALRCWVLNERLDELRPRPEVKFEWARAA